MLEYILSCLLKVPLTCDLVSLWLKAFMAILTPEGKEEKELGGKGDMNP